MYTTLLALLFACGDAEQTQEIPAPPSKEVKAQPKAKDAPDNSKATVAGDKAPAADGGDTLGGTAPKVTTSEKLMTTKEVKAPQSKLLPEKVERMLTGKANQEGYQSIKDFKLIKNECQAGGICTGIGQATAVRTTVTYAEGNGVSVKQDDGSHKAAIITKIEGDSYTVKYADNSEATVTKASVGLSK